MSKGEKAKVYCPAKMARGEVGERYLYSLLMNYNVTIELRDIDEVSIPDEVELHEEWFWLTVLIGLCKCKKGLWLFVNSLEFKCVNLLKCTNKYINNY